MKNKYFKIWKKYVQFKFWNKIDEICLRKLKTRNMFK